MSQIIRIIGLVLSISVALLPNGLSQGKGNTFELNTSFGIQQHDTRLFSFPAALSQGESGFGTYYYSASIQKTIINKKRTAVKAGIGWGLEVNNWARPYNSCFGDTDGTFCSPGIIDHYRIHLIQQPLSISYKLGKGERRKWNVGMSIIPSFWVSKKIENDDRRFTGFNFYSLENYMEAGFRISESTNISAQFRILQIRSIDHLWWDTLFLNSTTNNSDINKNIDTHNPIKVVLKLSQTF